MAVVGGGQLKLTDLVTTTFEPVLNGMMPPRLHCLEQLFTEILYPSEIAKQTIIRHKY
jgi:hypothetical protein